MSLSIPNSSEPMYHFFVRIFAAAEDQAAAKPLSISFDDAVQVLAELPNMFIEWDGSFVWRGILPAPWQLDGNLMDGGQTLSHVELKGNCPAIAFDQLLMCLATSPTIFCFEWVTRGIWTDERGFRRLAIGDSVGPDSQAASER